jgi:AmmeMemoRadiSam system protein B/AmmeMemoRadiSam system protein A
MTKRAVCNRRGELPFVVAVACVLATASCRGKEGAAVGQGNNPKPVEKVLESPIAGSWYPAGQDRLRLEIKSRLDLANSLPTKETEGGRLVALVSPHAGYRYSGAVAAHGFRLLDGTRVKRVVILGPSHKVPFRGVALTDATGWKTPLGTIPIDFEAVRELARAPGFEYRPAAFASEHSVDIQIPFLQMVAPRAAIVPLVVGEVDAATIRDAARAIRGLLDEGTVVVASSDFTHYGPNYGYVPFSDDVESRLKGLADDAFKAIRSLDAQGLADHVKATGDTICGAAPIEIMLTAIPHRVAATRVGFDTSGHLTGDFGNSVSYQSIAFREMPSKGPFVNLDFVSVKDQVTLLRVARETLNAEVRGDPTPDLGPQKSEGMLAGSFGVFVTLKQNGELRGCIGSIVGTEPLWRGVIRNTINAASHDPRFPRIQYGEEQKTEIEISVLTPPREVLGHQDIVAGRDGVILSRGASRAVFLPQVAPEQGWDVDEMLGHLAMKAGLPADAWKTSASFQTFQAHVFGEKDYPPKPR